MDEDLGEHPRWIQIFTRSLTPHAQPRSNRSWSYRTRGIRFKVSTVLPKIWTDGASSDAASSRRARHIVNLPEKPLSAGDKAAPLDASDGHC